MKLPDRITPDRLRDSIIQLQFSSQYPLEIIIGECSKLLHSLGWRYQNRLPAKQQQPGLLIDLGGNQPQHFFVEEKIRIQIQNNKTLSFNINGQYPGWSIYSELVHKVIDLLLSNKILTSIERIGLRYISQFPNMDMTDSINLKLSLPEKMGSLQNSSYRLSFREENVINTVNIANNILTTPGIIVNDQHVQKAMFSSTIDIDVTQFGLSITTMEQFKKGIIL